MNSLCLRTGKSVYLVLSLSLLLVVSFFAIQLRDASAAPQEGSSTEILEGAKKEGKFMWYIASTYDIALHIHNQFRKKYPFLQSEFYLAGSEPLLTKVLAETQAKKYIADVVVIPGGEAMTLKEKGFYGKYVSPQSKFFALGFKDPEGYWTDGYMTENVMIYNTKLIPPQEVPKTWNDLLNPKWKGKIGIDTKSAEWFSYMLKIMGQTNGMEYMKRLADQIKFHPMRAVLAQLVAAGELNMSLIYRGSAEQMKDKGAPVDWVGLDPVVPSIHPIGINVNAPHPNAAKLFVDFALSLEGQQEWARVYQTPSRSDVKALRMDRPLTVATPDTVVIGNYKNNMKLYRQVLMKK